MTGDHLIENNPTLIRTDRDTWVTVDSLDLEMLRCLASGMTQAKMAKFMNMKLSWVDRKRNNLYMKLGARNSAHAVAMALRNKII